jgi:hypothetical protein
MWVLNIQTRVGIGVGIFNTYTYLNLQNLKCFLACFLVQKSGNRKFT